MGGHGCRKVFLQRFILNRKRSLYPTQNIESQKSQVKMEHDFMEVFADAIHYLEKQNKTKQNKT